MKLGVLGGSFDPPHLGHLAMAEAARRAHGLERVLLMPTGSPPHKLDITPAADRLAMVRLAVEGREGLEASDLEVRRQGTTYTVETLEELRRLHPGVELFFIVGEDSLADLPGWREPLRILALARLVVVNRPGAGRGMAASIPGLSFDLGERIERDRVSIPPSPLESRRIRAALARGEGAAGEVPAPVLDYIERRGLYARGGA